MASSSWSNQAVTTPPVEKKRKLDKGTSKNLNAVDALTSQKAILDDIAFGSTTFNKQVSSRTQTEKQQVFTPASKIQVI